MPNHAVRSKSASTRPPGVTRHFSRKVILSALTLALAIWGLDGFSAIPIDRASASLKAEDSENSAAWLSIAAWFCDGNPEIHFLHARLARKAGDAEQFRAELKSFVALGGAENRAEAENTLAAAATGKSPMLVGQMADMLISETAEADEVCSAFAQGFVIAGEWDQASVLFKEWKNGFPDDARPYYANGRMLDHLRDSKGAEEEYRSAIERNPKFYPAAYALARTMLENGRAEESLEFFKSCSAMKHNAAPKIGMAKCLRQLGQNEAALAELNVVTKLPMTELRLSFAKVSEAAEGRPDLVELGSLLLSLGRANEAIPVLDQAIEQNPRDLDARYSRGIALRETGRTEEGKAEIDGVLSARNELLRADKIVDALDASKPSIDERLEIGRIYLEHGSLKTAEHWLLTAVNRVPDHRAAIELLIQLYSNWPRYDQELADKQLQKYREKLSEIDARNASGDVESAQN